MNSKIKAGLVQVLSYILAGTGSVIIVVCQYVSRKNQAPTGIKIAVPCLVALLIVFLVYWSSIKNLINRKLIAIETAKELGQVGQTNSIVANILSSIGIIVPLLIIATIFAVGGKYLTQSGIVLFELLGMYIVTIIGNIGADAIKKAELQKKELEQSEKFADEIAKKINKLPKRYE